MQLLQDCFPWTQMHSDNHKKCCNLSIQQNLFLEGCILTAWLTFQGRDVHKKAFGYTVNSFDTVCAKPKSSACLIYVLIRNQKRYDMEQLHNILKRYIFHMLIYQNVFSYINTLNTIQYLLK